MEILEVRGKSVEVAVDHAMRELGVKNRDDVEYEVLQEAGKGFLGMGGQDAIVRVKLRSQKRRRRRRPEGPGEGTGRGAKKPDSGRRDDGRARSGQGRSSRPSASGGKQDPPVRSGRSPQSRAQSRTPESRATEGRSTGGRAAGNRGSERRTAEKARPGRNEGRSAQDRTQDRDRREQKGEPVVPIEDHVPVVKEFLEGLVEAFGLEGSVNVRVEDETVIAEVSGSQTEAMVGVRGSVIEAIHELTKTVMHRKNQGTARLRLDIAGYGERRRQALSIYADQLISQVENDGGEIMLEPMSAADRKVIHDAVAARGTVRSYSEGVAPQRYVVIGKLTTADAKAVSGSDETGVAEASEEAVEASPMVDVEESETPPDSGDDSEE